MNQAISYKATVSTTFLGSNNHHQVYEARADKRKKSSSQHQEFSTDVKKRRLVEDDAWSRQSVQQQQQSAQTVKTQESPSVFFVHDPEWGKVEESDPGTLLGYSQSDLPQAMDMATQEMMALHFSS